MLKTNVVCISSFANPNRKSSGVHYYHHCNRRGRMLGDHVRMHSILRDQDRHNIVCRASSIRARWCFDCRYGTKMKGVALMQEWVRDIGSRADPGLTPENARINSGSIGSPESRLELEVEFASLEALEKFWGSIPGDLHQEWSRNVADVIIDGSPTWEVYRSVDAFVKQGDLLPRRNEETSSLSSVELATSDDIDKYAREGFGKSMDTARDMMVTSEDKQDDDSPSVVKKDGSPGKAKQILDWKGDPMHINPGDKLPFTFD